MEEFLRRKYKRYVERNVLFSNGFKKEKNEIFHYLWNRPRNIVKDILNKMKQFSQPMIESVQYMPTIPEATFFVRGNPTHGTEAKTYCVDFRTK